MIRHDWFRRGAASGAAVCIALLAFAAPVRAQTAPEAILRVPLSTGRSYPIQLPIAVTNVSVSNPEVADVAVIGQRDVVINGRSAGETDVILFSEDNTRRHYRVSVRSAATDRQQVVLAVKIAEVRKDALRSFGVSALARTTGNDGFVRGGQGLFRTDDAIDPETGAVNVPNASFFTLLTDFGTSELLALIEAEETRGTARILAEPTLAVADRDSASFLAGGELPIPFATGLGQVTILFREFGVRLNFNPEILNDTLIKLQVAPEVSSLDYANAITLQGFEIPAIRTRRVRTTVDVQRSQSLVISGLFNNEREKVRTGIPFLSQIPIIGALFGTTRWLNNETELVVIVTPVVYDPRRPRAQDLPRILPDTALPAREALEPRLVPPPPAQRPPTQSQSVPPSQPLSVPSSSDSQSRQP